jgi:hypothetical protein
MFLKQSTARTVPFGPFLDDTDGKTAETALTLSQADIRLSKNGGAFAQTNNSAGATHLENGHYGVPLDTTDTNTAGWLRVAVHETGALPVWQDFLVLPAAVYDALITNAGGLLVTLLDGSLTAAKIATDAITAAKIQDGALTAGKLAGDAITAAKVAADVGTELADALLKRDLSAVTGEAARSPVNALRFLRNKKTLSGGTLTVTKEDDATTAWTAAVTTDPAAAPVTVVDPT